MKFLTKYGIAAAAEANGRSLHEEADLQMSDANVLYGIMRGEQPPSQLLDTMITVGNWQKQQIDTVAADLVAWLTKQGYVKEGAAAVPGKAATGKDGQQFKDPLDERLTKIEKDNQAARDAETQRQQTAERDRVGKIFIDRVTELAKAKGVDEKDVSFYLSQVAALVNGNPQVAKRVGLKNFVDINRFFDTVHNRELERLKRYNENQLKKQTNKNRNPKIPAGGTPAAPASQAKRNVANRDDRIAAAAEMLTSH
jgi:hypothetical protein